MLIEIEGKKIGNNQKPYIVAELSANHNGSIQAALDTIKIAKKCGADAIKIQTYNADSMTIDCDNDDFLIQDAKIHGINGLINVLGIDSPGVTSSLSLGNYIYSRVR